MNIEIENKFSAFIRSLYLPGNLSDSIIIEYYREIISLSSIKVSENLEIVSEFFFLITKKACCNYNFMDDSDIIKKFQVYKDIFIEAFERIAKADLPENSGNKYISLLHFLNDIKSSTFNHYQNNQMEVIYDKFSDMLFDIRLIFSFIGNDQCAYFPLSEIIAKFILSRNLMQNIGELETAIIKTFYLALEIFKITKSTNDLDKLNKLIQDCNLRFLTYSTQLDQNRGWENNYRANHVIVLYSCENGESKVLIRSNVKEYFGDCESIEVEKNGEGRPIGYFIENLMDERDSLVSFWDEMKGDRIRNRFQLTKLVFNDGYRNLFYSDYTLVKSPDDNLRPVNPFSKTDKKSVFKVKEVDVSDSYEFCNQLRPFYMCIVNGGILNFATFGLFVLLYRMNGDLLPDCVFNITEESNNCWQNRIIQAYVQENLEKLPEMLKNFNEILIGDIDRKSIESLQICPIQLDLKNQIYLYIQRVVTDGLLLDSYPNPLVESLTAEGVGYFLSNKNNTVIPYEAINGIRSSSYNLSDEVFVVLKKDEYYYVGDECNRIIQLSNLISELNTKLIPEKELKQINQVQVICILDRMKAQSNSLLEGLALCCNQEDFFSMKILFHFFKFQIFDRTKIQEFFSLYINKLQWLKFNFLKDDELLGSEYFDPSTLVIFKDSDRFTGNTCETVCKKYVGNPFRKQSACCGAVLDICEDLYSYNGNPIKKMVFVFDNSITGKSVLKALNFYFYGAEDSLERYRYFYQSSSPSSKQIQVKDVIYRNSPILEVRVFYSTQNAKRKIEEFLLDFQKENEIVVERQFDLIIQETSEDVYDHVKLVYSDERYLDRDYRDNCLMIREINQPKKNWLRDDFYDKGMVFSLFIKQGEIKYKQ